MVVPRLPIPKSNLDAVFDHNSPRTPNVQPYEVVPVSLPDLPRRKQYIKIVVLHHRRKVNWQGLRSSLQLNLSNLII